MYVCMYDDDDDDDAKSLTEVRRMEVGRLSSSYGHPLDVPCHIFSHEHAVTVIQRVVGFSG